jgi:hypothetical protein
MTQPNIEGTVNTAEWVGGSFGVQVGQPDGPTNISGSTIEFNGDPGTATYVLTSNGPGQAPTWQVGAGGITLDNIGLSNAYYIPLTTAPSGTVSSMDVAGSFTLQSNPSTQVYILLAMPPSPPDANGFAAAVFENDQSNACVVGINTSTATGTGFGLAGASSLQATGGELVIGSSSAGVQIIANGALAFTIAPTGDFQVGTGSNSGTAGQVLTSGGAGAPPTWSNPSQLAVYAKASLPTGTAGQVIYVSDATGAHVTGSLCFFNGTAWIDVTTGVAVV